MPILRIQIGQTGLVDVKPRLCYILTNDPIATVLTTGYLNHAVQQGNVFTQSDLVAVITQETPTSDPATNWYGVAHSANNWTLTGLTPSLTLPSGQIFVGDVSNVAQAVAMTGDVTIDTAGVTTISNNAITTNKILDDNVTVDKLEPQIKPAVNFYFGGQVTLTGGNATENVAVAGCLGTDVAVAQILDDNGTPVVVTEATPGTAQVALTFDVAPVAGTKVNLFVARAVV